MTHSHTGRTGPVGSVYDSGPTSVQNPLPTASSVETAKILAEVELPTISKGPIIRRPRMVAAVENLGLEARAVTRMQTIAEKYGRGPIMLALPGRKMSMVLDPDHVHRILEESPEPFATAETLKRHALKHFEPQVALISHGPERARRRRSMSSCWTTITPSIGWPNSSCQRCGKKPKLCSSRSTLLAAAWTTAPISRPGSGWSTGSCWGFLP